MTKTSKTTAIRNAALTVDRINRIKEGASTAPAYEVEQDGRIFFVMQDSPGSWCVEARGRDGICKEEYLATCEWMTQWVYKYDHKSLRSAKAAIVWASRDSRKAAAAKPATEEPKPEPKPKPEPTVTTLPTVLALREEFKAVRAEFCYDVSRAAFNAALKVRAEALHTDPATVRTPSEWVMMAKSLRIPCPRCAATGRFITGTENGKPTGPGGECFRCDGKSYQDLTDAKRNAYYDNHATHYVS